MYALLLSIPLIAALFVAAWKIGRALTDAWFEHRLQMRMLSQLEKNPDFKEESVQLKAALAAPVAEAKVDQRREFIATGLSLVFVGGLSVAGGLAVDAAQSWGTGIYIGGIVCIVVGFVFTLVGVLLHYLERGRDFSGDVSR